MMIGDHSLRAFFELDAIDRHVVSALRTSHADRTADAQTPKGMRAARMRLFQLDRISYLKFDDIHGIRSPVEAFLHVSRPVLRSRISIFYHIINNL